MGWSHDVNASKKEGFGPSDECRLVSNDDIMFPPPLASVSPARLGGKELSEFFSVLAEVSQVSDLICRLMLLGYL